jgi:3-phosphoshikimate 1-carboxyvinyltransferase
MEECITILHHAGEISGTVKLPGSKSESNRALIINALSGNNSELRNLSTSSDTKLLQNALAFQETLIDIQDAGTAMRFLTAYFAATHQDKTLTGSPRMLQRPIAPLVDALSKMGANIEYTGISGFPPIKILGSKSNFTKNKISIKADVSSQFISALLMIAPVLPEGLKIEFSGKIISRPYIEMTLAIMHQFGIEVECSDSGIKIHKQNYQPTTYTVESDWSCASYWYLIAALSNDPAIFLKGLKRQSFQGDAIVQELFKPFGIITEFSDTGAFITKTDEDFSIIPTTIDFTEYPDLAQTYIVLCAAKNIHFKFTGLQSLRIKETDRILALQNELKKFSIQFIEKEFNVFSIHGKFNPVPAIINTYNDHRMAMAFAPLALLCHELKITNPLCVEKSYPTFWEDLEESGFSIKKFS